MKVAAVQLRNFMSHDETSVEIPRRGVMLVTGPNGAGKSSLLEAVAWGLFGKTLRGTDPWRDGVAADIEVALESGLRVARSRKGQTSKLAFWEGERPDSPKHDTATKAQEALERVVGAFDLWRRTHVFSSQDASHFTLSTDKERKVLLEQILGVARFDPALEACRVELKVAERNRDQATNALAVRQTRSDMASKRLEDARAALATLGPAGDASGLREEAREIQVAAERADHELAALRARQRLGDRQGVEQLERARGLQRQAEALRDARCATCGAAVSPEKRATLEAEASRLFQEAELARAKGLEESTGVADEIVAREGFVRRARERAHGILSAAKQIEETATGRARLEKAVREAQESILKDQDELDEYQAKFFAANVDALELAGVEQVLGLKGVRAHVLGRALSGVEAVANNWLTKIAGAGIQLQLRPWSEKKTGGVSDSIGLEILGVGAGRGYRATSGGERRRIDVSLLFALAEVAAAAQGTVPGTLWFDEVFDALDHAGVDAVASALSELAADRGVIVVTHSEALIERLPSARHVRVEGGHLAQVR